VEQELGNFVALRIPECHGVPYRLVRQFPGLDIVVDAVEQVQFVGEQRPHLPKFFQWVNTGIQPWEV
jgi:hypothetical protein